MPRLARGIIRPIATHADPNPASPCIARGGFAAAGDAAVEGDVGPPRIARNVSLHGASPWHPASRTCYLPAFRNITINTDAVIEPGYLVE